MRKKPVSKIKGIGKKTATVLAETGIKTIGELSSAKPKKISKVKGISKKSAEKLITKAKKASKTNTRKNKKTSKVGRKKIIKDKFLRTGINGFDKLFKNGIPDGSTVLVEGGPGSGKTIFNLQLAYNACERGLKTLYMSFEEPERRLRNHIENFGMNPKKYEKKGRLMLKRFNALDIARSVEALLSEAKKELLIDIQPVLIPQNFKPDVVCIDSLSSIASAFSGEEARFRIYMEQLFRYLENHNITSFLVRETPHPTHVGNVVTRGGEAVSFLSDGIIVLYDVFYKTGKRGRAIEVLKMRGEDIDRRIVEAVIKNKKGFVVRPKKQIKGSYHLT